MWPYRKKMPLTYKCLRCSHEWHDGRCGVAFYDPQDSSWVEGWCVCDAPKDRNVMVVAYTPAQREVILRLTSETKAAPAPTPLDIPEPVVWEQLQIPGTE
jgi:hypothetical protein